jgi:SAM-dependent methyltransferase
LNSYSLKSIRWSFRKTQLGIQPDDLVLEIGSGANPHYRSDVIVDKYLGNTHRYSDLVIDRPFVLADGTRLPFADDAFDYVILFHVLEHVQEPAKFLEEVMRVGKAGYIETPNAIFERLIPYDVHCLEVMDVNHRLYIYQKPTQRHDVYFSELNLITRHPGWRKLFYSNPSLFHVCHQWKDKIGYQICNPSTVPFSVETDSQTAPEEHPRFSIRSLALNILRFLRKFGRRHKILDIHSMLHCPTCKLRLQITSDAAKCNTCGHAFRLRSIPDFTKVEEEY